MQDVRDITHPILSEISSVRGFVKPVRCKGLVGRYIKLHCDGLNKSQDGGQAYTLTKKRTAYELVVGLNWDQGH